MSPCHVNNFQLIERQLSGMSKFGAINIIELVNRFISPIVNGLSLSPHFSSLFIIKRQ